MTEYGKVMHPDYPWMEIADNEENIMLDLEKYTLDPVFEYYGNFVNRSPEFVHPEGVQKYAGCTVIWGNFLNLSHVFRVITDDQALISRFADAIERNKATPEYQDARARMIDERKRIMEERERLVKQYGNYLGHERPR